MYITKLNSQKKAAKLICFSVTPKTNQLAHIQDKVFLLKKHETNQ